MVNIDKPLAYRIRPNKLDDVIGQDDIKSFLNNLIDTNHLVSMIFYGSPGTGKTTTARAFCNSYNINYISLNAVLDNKTKLEESFKQAMNFYPSIVIIDEIHRLDKGKQDLLLPHLENGDFYMIGCTTANPFIALNSALRSRCKLLEFNSLDKDNIFLALKKAVSNENGLNLSRNFTDDALKTLAKMSSGDLRFAYNQLEVISISFPNTHTIDEEDVKKTIRFSNCLSDKDEDEHYNLLSAFQKSIRGSEVDAAIYYLARLINTGDLESIVRRLLVTAYEDIGLASVSAVSRTVQACDVALKVGLQEARIPLAVAVIDLTLSPKSKSAEIAIDRALDSVSNSNYKVRDYLSYIASSDKERYDYLDDRLWSIIEYLPDELLNCEFYTPSTTGKYERALKENYDILKKIKRFTSIKKAKESLK